LPFSSEEVSLVHMTSNMNVAHTESL